MRSMDDLTRRGFLAGLAAGAWCWPRRDWTDLPTAGGRFDIAARPAGDEPPLFATGFLRHDPAPAYAHCPSLAPLPDGRLACVWYAGSREGAEDVAGDAQGLKRPNGRPTARIDLHPCTHSFARRVRMPQPKPPTRVYQPIFASKP